MTRAALDVLPNFSGLLDAYERDEQVRKYAEHNHFLWRCTHGGLALTRRSPLSFDPRLDYWFCWERRILVAFFDEFFRESYAPAEAMRRLAHATFLHFDRARADGRFGERAPLARAPISWSEHLSAFEKEIEVWSELPHYVQLQRVWPRILTAPTFRELLRDYVRAAGAKPSVAALEGSFVYRLPWFAYLGLQDLRDLEARQRFFYGFYQTFGSTNAYRNGGGLSFAPVLQNNPAGELLDYVARWKNGEAPRQTGFEVEGKDERSDRSRNACVVELFGFLNLHRMPFHNSVSASAYEAFREPHDTDIVERLARIGRLSETWVSANRSQADRLANSFRKLTETSSLQPQFCMEGIRPQRIAKQYPEDAAAQVDVKLAAELGAAAKERAGRFTREEAAVAMLHLLLDASIYSRAVSPEQSVYVSATAVVRERARATTPERALVRIPAGLRAVANDALGYLHSGHHVLFAGPPGTGKTTVAQFVGHAWNRELESVVDEITLDDAPVTTVGNSAWTPFHTIGGIVPDGHGAYCTRPGIFVRQDESNVSEWSLRPECLVFDELNRADLDRCIGELYPLLSRSVERVCPAGIPGVEAIRAHPRFRLVATVNDATLDDIVFPISEGLARRFVRLELLGATLEDLAAYIGDASERAKVAMELVQELFTACHELRRTSPSEADEHLPFGVGYFSTLRDWAVGRLRLSGEFAEREMIDQARAVLFTSLRGVVRVRGMEDVLQWIDDKRTSR